MKLDPSHCLLLVPFTLPLEAATVSWLGSSGQTPEAVGYTLSNSSTPEVPVLSASTLTLQNDDVIELMSYSMSGPDLSIPAQTVIDFEMAYISGFTNQNFRDTGLVFATVSSGVNMGLFIGDDEVFFLNGQTSRGPENTTLDTHAFHQYQLVIDGTTAGSTVNLYQDTNLVLSGSTYAYAPATTEVISFGDGTTNANGETQWRSFIHNAGVPEPSSSLLALIGMSAFLLGRRRSHFSSLELEPSGDY
ncbi:MAG: PEP-CTERM sorting domain-containing protein [Verrucomicrobiaceae bacterium]